MELTKEMFTYDLPEELIAQHPMENRDESRLLVVDRATGETFDRHFYDILDYLQPGDLLVRNNTRVIPARLLGEKDGTGAHVEVFLLKPLGGDNWECLVKPGRRLKPGDRVTFPGGLRCQIEAFAEDGGRKVRFMYEGDFEEKLALAGEMPLPPYIHEKLTDAERYQTVYSKHKGSVAAPTAGLHFTPELFEKLKAKGAQIADVTLDVGLGTFRPVKEENILNHHMHSEHFTVPAETAEAVNKAKAEGRRVIAVGTTVVRTLESAADENGQLRAMADDTSIFIYPGYTFKLVDGLITNFHLPESTLLMLISAFYDREKMLRVYNEAVQKRYRFFSFGDAMFIK